MKKKKHTNITGDKFKDTVNTDISEKKSIYVTSRNQWEFRKLL